MASVELRELLASVKAVWDADVSHPTPTLGPRLPLHLDPVSYTRTQETELRRRTRPANRR